MVSTSFLTQQLIITYLNIKPIQSNLQGKVHGWANKVFFGGGTQGGHDSHEGNYCEDLRKGYGTYLFDDLGGVTRGGFLRGQFQNDNGVLHGNDERHIPLTVTRYVHTFVRRQTRLLSIHPLNTFYAPR